MESYLACAAQTLRLDDDGAQLFPGVLDAAVLHALLGTLADQPSDQAGVRLFDIKGLGAFLGPKGVIGALAASCMEGAPRPVRAILFDKTAEMNWSLAWHQDRVVAVRERIEVAGFGPWSRKHGALHVAPPFEVLSGMRTLRVHFDPVPEGNAPLLIAPGSHRLGRIAEQEVPDVVQRRGVATCTANAGDVWVYATPILHASERASEPAHRRVLQVDYATGDLPGGLRWLGV
ncbi:phytanoyl-CoA dioxygenase family protein [Phenylobacterium aquaticum]|uniref:phytanoyl-CoA dioxygenase family protein n=1 Tax=Phenylobacterium aquaticum TaxID=1763816 RepID=UPI0026EE1116|nr:phytanoyl-CoA dioxygenase family protein [Phenylobacterium aquaticum]